MDKDFYCKETSNNGYKCEEQCDRCKKSDVADKSNSDEASLASHSCTDGDSIEQFLTECGFKRYGYTDVYPVRIKNLYQKRVESKVVCETNDKIFLNVWEAAYDDLPARYEVEIVAEITGIWWQLKAYSLSEKELRQRLGDIHITLRSMIESIQ